jgi:hypothetical protein
METELKYCIVCEYEIEEGDSYLIVRDLNYFGQFEMIFTEDTVLFMCQYCFMNCDKGCTANVPIHKF